MSQLVKIQPVDQLLGGLCVNRGEIDLSISATKKLGEIVRIADAIGAKNCKQQFIVVSCPCPDTNDFGANR